MIRLVLCLMLVATEAVAQPYVFVFLNKKTDKLVLAKEEEDKLMEGHMNNIKRLAQEGKLIDAGPFEGGGGIFIFNSGSVEEVSQWISTDPAVKANRWNIEIFPFEVIRGAVCRATEPVEMTMYSFVRFDPKSSGIKSRDQAFIDFVQRYQADVLLAGLLGSEGASLMIIRGEIESAAIEAAPALVNSRLGATYKSLYIAKGSFCEK